MAPPIRTVKLEVPDEMQNNKFNIIASYQDSSIADTSNFITDIKETDGGVTYFVDEEGNYYYQPAPDVQNIVLTEKSIENEQDSKFVIKHEDSFPSVTLVPSGICDGELNYLLVVQEPDEKAVAKETVIREKDEEKQTISNTAYDFLEDICEEVSSDEENEDTVSMKTPRNKILRPHFTCTYCRYSSPRRYLLLRHMRSHSADRPHRCGVCERGFKTTAALQNHVNTHSGVKPHACRECGRQFTTSGELIRHVRYKHTHEKPHKCTECSYSSVELSKLRRHTRCHTGERPYQCPHCTYASPDTFKLKRHLRTHTGEKPYKCDLCDMAFAQSNSLKSHKLIHNLSSRPVYACELCPTTCGRKTDLRLHVQKLHTAGQLHKCNTCGKCFPDRYSYRVHNKSHQGEKCFKCDVCPYACAARRHLHSHMLRHTDEKPFVCDECDASFRQKQLLRRHQNLYHNPDYVPPPPKEKAYQCHECSRQFAHKGNLLRHLTAHSAGGGRARALRPGVQRTIRYSEAEALEAVNKTTNKKKKETRKDAARAGEILTVPAGDGGRFVFVEVIESEDDLEYSVTDVESVFYVEATGHEPEGGPDGNKKQNSDTKKKSGVTLNTKDQDTEVENDIESCFGFDITNC